MLIENNILTTAPTNFSSKLQEMVYAALNDLVIPFERVDTHEAITMEDCVSIEQKLKVPIVKTLFLCNRQQTEFFLFVTTATKPFKTKDLSAKLNISRLSFASPALMEKMLGTKVGAATIFGLLLDTDNEIRLVLDQDVLKEAFYGCSDGTTTCYMKVGMKDVTETFLKHVEHQPLIVEI